MIFFKRKRQSIAEELQGVLMELADTRTSLQDQVRDFLTAGPKPYSGLVKEDIAEAMLLLLQLSAVRRLNESSRRLECATLMLGGLTIALVVFTILLWRHDA